MQALWNGQVIAEAEQAALIRIEGNWYFPSDSIKKEYFKPSQTHTTCFWKGEASYYTVDVNGKENPDGAWYYPIPKDGSVEKVGKDFTNYVAFWHGIEVK
jgi:uncharacterized protein (DUF427 family)